MNLKKWLYRNLENCGEEKTYEKSNDCSSADAMQH